MGKQTLASSLNEILLTVHLGLPPVQQVGLSYVFDADVEPSLCVTGRDRKRFDSAIDDLLRSMPHVKGTISRESVIEELIPLVREKKLHQESFSLVDGQNFENALCKIPLQKYSVLRRIYGLGMAADAGMVSLGDFEIGRGEEFFGSKMDHPLLKEALKPEDNHHLFIKCSVPARDAIVALQVAAALFNRFELVFCFLIGRRAQRIEVGILNYHNGRIGDSFVLEQDGRPERHRSAWEGALETFVLGDPRFPALTAPYVRLFEFLTGRTNDLEKHLIRCVEWTGQAITEPNEAAALVKAAIALEVLFGEKEHGVITPSIMAQIAEKCAFLLGNRNSLR